MNKSIIKELTIIVVTAVISPLLLNIILSSLTQNPDLYYSFSKIQNYIIENNKYYLCSIIIGNSGGAPAKSWEIEIDLSYVKGEVALYTENPAWKIDRSDKLAKLVKRGDYKYFNQGENVEIKIYSIIELNKSDFQVTIRGDGKTILSERLNYYSEKESPIFPNVMWGITILIMLILTVVVFLYINKAEKTVRKSYNLAVSTYRTNIDHNVLKDLNYKELILKGALSEAALILKYIIDENQNEKYMYTHYLAFCEYVQRGDFSDWKTLIDTTIANGHDLGKAYFITAYIRYCEGKYTLSRDLIEKSLSYDDNDVGALLLRTLLELKYGEANLAFNYILRTIEADPWCVEAAVIIASLGLVFNNDRIFKTYIQRIIKYKSNTYLAGRIEIWNEISAIIDNNKEKSNMLHNKLVENEKELMKITY